MSIKLPIPIDNYFKADRNNNDIIERCFTQDAIVKDENHTYSGFTAIKEWNAHSSMKYKFTSEPFASEENDGKTIITSHVTGNFPGSPVDLRYFFSLRGNKIAFLEITL